MHLLKTVFISSTSLSSTSGFCLSSISMKKRLMESVSGAAITISSTHCLTLSAESSPWFCEKIKNVSLQQTHDTDSMT